MTHFQKNILLIAGTAVGAGIFSLPYALQQVGTIPFIALLLLLGYITIRVNIYFYEVVVKVKEKHHIPGYARIVLGEHWGKWASLLLLFSTYGAVLAFLSIGGEFMPEILPITQYEGMMLLYAIGTILVLSNGKDQEWVDVLLSLVKLFLFTVIIIVSGGFVFNIGWSNVPVLTLNPMQAFGIILFSLTSFSIIPELHTGKDSHASIAVAKILIMALYAVFAFMTVPLLQGTLVVFPHPQVQSIFLITSIVSVFTPYLLMSWIGADTFHKDFGLKHKAALGLTTFIPFILILFKIDGFNSLLSITGGIFLGGVGFIICHMYSKLFPQKNKLEVLFIKLLFIAGILFEALSFL